MAYGQQNGCCINGIQRYNINKQVSADGNHGNRGLPLAQFICSDHLAVSAGDHAKSADQKFAEEDDEYDPGSEHPLFDKDKKRGKDEQLIGDGIEEFSKIGKLSTM